MSGAFEISPFSEERFFSLLSSARTTESQVSLLRCPKYLAGYLKEIGAKTVVVEFDYVDADYLDDFANFYVKCFSPYEARCRRLHFFSGEFNESDLEDSILGHKGGEALTPNFLQDQYLGFIVVRPLARAVIGRTALVTFADDNGRRRFPATRCYYVNLFGVCLTVHSLAFQAQDSVLAACATVALWSAFQKTAELFHTVTPTPARITHSATSAFFDTRVLPSQGLNVVQIAKAISSVDLEPEILEYSNALPLLSLLAGYLDFGLPVVLGVDIEGLGGHAVTVVGYSLRDIEPQAESYHSAQPKIPIRRRGSRIDALYAHDDGLGPFAKMSVQINTKPKMDQPAVSFTGTWQQNDGSFRRITPQYVIIPLHHKIRLSYMATQQWVAQLHEVMKSAFTADEITNIEWDIALTSGNHLKEIWRANDQIPRHVRASVLFAGFPKHVWQVALHSRGKMVLEMFLDATEVKAACPVLRVIYHDTELEELVGNLLSIQAISKVVAPQFLERLKAETK